MTDTIKPRKNLGQGLIWTLCVLGLAAATNVQANTQKDTNALRVKVGKILKGVQAKTPVDGELKAIFELGPSVVPVLGDVFRDSGAKWEHRWLASMALSQFDGKQSTSHLIWGLGNDVFMVRLAATTALGYKEGEAIKTKIRKMLTDKALVVRSAAILSLMRLKDSSSLDLMEAAFYAKENQGYWIQGRILDAFSVLGSVKDAPKVQKMLRQGPADTHERACTTLSSIVPSDRFDVSQGKGDTCRTYWMNWSGRKSSVAQQESAPKPI